MKIVRSYNPNKTGRTQSVGRRSQEEGTPAHSQWEKYKFRIVCVLVEKNDLWQSRVEIQHYSVEYFDRVTTFETL